jgi:two-component system, chemotaxis family, protein-glutamate methylesterase/glutaminase
LEKIRVLIVDDSAFMRKFIQDLLSNDPRIEIAGTARNGEDAIKKIKKLNPAVVTMDVEMPVMDGLEALKIIMNSMPIPIIMLSSTTGQGAENTMIAIQSGAVDFIAKPSGAISLDMHKIQAELIEKVISASKSNLTHLASDIANENLNASELPHYSKIEMSHIAANKQVTGIEKKLICIGTSTGGPRALQAVLTKLPASIDAPLLIVQHMPPGFTKSLANRLDSLSNITVKEAEEGDILKKGTAYIAPGGFHLTVKPSGSNLVVHLSQSPPRNGHRPSVDVLFESVSVISDYMKIAVVMTGMGADGAQGVIDLKNKGPVTAITESKNTAIVFGMPKAVIATKLVDEVQDLQFISETIMKYL